MSSEGNSIGLDLDPFVDIVPPPAISNANAGGKFQPRAKPRPRKGKSEAIALAVSNTTMDDNASLASTVTDNLQSAKFVDVGDGKVVDSVSSSLTNLDNMVRKEPLRNDDHANPGILLSNDDRSSGLAKSMGENADIFSGLENIQDFVTQSPGSTEIPVPPSNEETEGQSRFPAHNSVNSSALRACNVANLDAVTSNEAAIQTNNGRPEPSLHVLGECQLNQSYSLPIPDDDALWKESESLANLESPDIQSKSTIASQRSARKFQPKPKVQTGKEKPNVSILPPDAVESVVPPPNAQFAPFETVCLNEGSIPTFPAEVVADYSSTSFGNSVTPDPTMSEFPVNEEQINLTEGSHSCDTNVLQQEDVPGVPEKENYKSRKRKSSSVSNPSEKSKQSSLAGGMNENGKSSWQLRKRTAAMQLVDESEDDEAHTSNGVPPSNSVADEEDNDYDYRVDEENDNEDGEENTSHKKRASEKSKQPVTGKSKPVRRRKKNNDAPEQPTQEPRKKFSHSTRRKSRLKDLLSIPEDEIDFQKMPFKDIILLAGYKESLAVKEEKASKDASANQSTSNSFHGEGSHNEEDANPSEQDGCYANDQSNSLFNSHSFMDKTPTARWSKQDTELFYEGIRQFGTDLSMIQQLFPGRTRHQIKLKYKKEERQHPLRLSEALNSRAKDNSYFEKVIEQLQQVAAQAEKESNKGDSAGLTDEETELNPETNEEVAKSELDEYATVEGDPLKYDEDEDDDDLWSSY